MATHPGRIKERLIAAFNDAVLPMVSAAVLPEEPRRIWQTRVWEPLTRVHDLQRGAAAASLANVGEDQACAIAASIVTVEAMVELAVHGGHR